jgi:hypothetical protein
MSPRSERLLLLVILVGSAFVRLVHLGELPLGAPGSEEGTSWWVVAAQLEHGWPRLPGGEGYWKGWPYTLLASLFSLGGLSALSLRLPSALASLAAVPLAWWGTRGLLGRCGLPEARRAWPALLAAWLTGFSAWSVFLGRWGRFYALGQLLFLAGVVLAVAAFTEEGKRARRLTLAFGAVALLAAATLHTGGLLLLALPFAWALGRRPEPSWLRTLAPAVALTALWYLGVVFLWKSGHVRGGGGVGDLREMTASRFFVRDMVLLFGLTVPAWARIARARGERGEGRAPRWPAVLLSAVILVLGVGAGPWGIGRGDWQSLHALLRLQPLTTVAALVSLLLLPWLARKVPAAGRRALGLLWLLTLLPVVIVGASQGKFATRYLLFAAPLLSVLLAAALGLALARRSGPRTRWLPGVACLLAALALLPEAGPTSAGRAALLPVGARLDSWTAPSRTRPYLLDLETPCRWIEDRREPEDLVVVAHRSVPAVFLGRVDAWFSRPKLSVMHEEPGGGLRNLLTGEPVIHEVEDLLALCEGSRVFVLVDLPQLHARGPTRRLRKALQTRTGGPAFTTPSGLAEVFVLERGCGREPGGSGGSLDAS